MRSFWLTFIFVILIAYSGYCQFQNRYNLFERMVTLEIDSTITSYNLPDSFLIKYSEQVLLDSIQLKPGIEYVMEYIQGRIKFLKILTTGQQLRIYYRFLPLQIQRNYFHRELLIYQPQDSGKPITRKLPSTKRRTSETASSLKQNGSIVRGISIGTNQGLKLESGLRMQISGKIADKLEVVAALTDQNTPIQPEGNTQTLQEIDKVFIQLKGDRFQATLGDYYLSYEGTEFSPYNRKLQGVMGTVELGNMEVTLSGAVSRGKFTTNYFLGQEGNQGPYQLKGDRGQIDIIVLAGTEKVWIDGQLISRGEDNDYIIEYSNGQITFTRHRLITADSRITVDFQYSDQKFQRSLYGLNLSTQTKNDKFKLGMRLLRESDNKNNPLDYSLTDENRSRLQLAGNNLDSAFVSGINYLGSGKGNYNAVDSAGVRFYRYVGPNAGDYNIAFNYIGPGNGDYKLVGYANYRYVGPGNGNYNPVVFLTPPESHDLVDMELAYQPWKNLQINTEMALSRLDKNLLSSKDDGNNSGLAISTRFGLKQQKFLFFGSNLGKFDLRGKYRRVQQQFQYIDRTEEVEKNRKWDFTDTSIQKEEIIEMEAGYFPIEQMNIIGSLGENNRGQNFHSRRWELGSEILFKKIPQLSYRIESIDSRDNISNRIGNWVRQHSTGQYQFWKLKSAIAFQAESKEESFQDTLNMGFRYHEVGPSLKLTDWRKMSFTVGLTQRHQDRFEKEEFIPESRALTQFAGWELRDWNNLSISMEFTHRKRSYADSSIGNKLTDLADFRAGYSPLNRAIITNWHYQLSNTQVARQERIYIKVERGQGNYRFDEDFNEYVPDALNGDYILRVRATEDFIPVIELRASSTIKLQPELLWKSKSRSKSFPTLKKWLSSISTETFIQLEEKTNEPNVWSIYRLELSQFQRDSTTIYGTKNFRQDLYWDQNNRKFSLRLRYNKRNNLNNQYLEGGQRLNLVEREVRIKSQIAQKIGSQLDVQNRHEQKIYRIPGRSDKDIYSNEIALDISYRPRQPLELAMKTRWTQAENRGANQLKVNFISLTPRLNYSFRGKGRLRVELEFNKVEVTPKNAIVPYEMVSGNRGGTNLRWIASLDYNVSRYLRASFSWNGRYEEYLDRPIYTVKAEMRAYF